MWIQGKRIAAVWCNSKRFGIMLPTNQVANLSYYVVQQLSNRQPTNEYQAIIASPMNLGARRFHCCYSQRSMISSAIERELVEIAFLVRSKTLHFGNCGREMTGCYTIDKNGHIRCNRNIDIVTKANFRRPDSSRDACPSF